VAEEVDRTFSRHRWFDVFLAANWLFACAVIWLRLDYLSVDLAGHMASAHGLKSGLFHWYSDRFFLGAVQNLFYPPLDDLLLAFWYAVTGDQWVVAFRIHLCVLVGLVLLGYRQIASMLRTIPGLAFYAVLVAVVLHMDKPGFARLQGNALTDLFRTGLTSQFLGTAMLLLLIRELLTRGRMSRLIPLLSLTMLSHIVGGLVAGLLTLSVLTAGRRFRDAVVAGAAAAAVSAAYLIPFLASSAYAAKTNIHVFPPFALLLASLVAVAALRGDPRRICLPAVAILLALPETLFVNVPGLRDGVHYPECHWNRLPIYSFILTGIALSLGIDSLGWSGRWPGLAAWRATGWRSARIFPWRRLLNPAPLLLLCIPLLFWDVRPIRWDRVLPAMLEPGIDLRDYDRVRWPDDGAMRGCYWSWTTRWAFDHGIDAWLTMHDPAYFSIKGRVWESSRNNTALASYLVTLDGLPSVPDYAYYYGLSCPVLRCVAEGFIDDYRIARLIVPQDLKRIADLRDQPAGAGPEATAAKVECMTGLLNEGYTRNYRLERVGALAFGGDPYQLPDVVPREGVVPGNRPILPLAGAWKAATVPDFEDSVAITRLASVVERCDGKTRERSVWLWDAHDTRRLQEWLEAAPGPAGQEIPIGARREGEGVYRFFVGSGTDIPFLIKLNYQPGLHLIGADGRELPLLDGYPHMVGYGRGEMTLEYRRPWTMWAGYAISLGAVLSLTGLALFRSFRPRSPV